MTARSAFLACASFAIALSACASTGGSYPSLALREAERIHGKGEPVTAEPAPAVVPEQPSADLAVAATRLADRAGESHRRFESQQGRAAALVGSARGSATASDAWSVASIALAGLHTARGETSLALSELDSLDIADRASNANGATANSTSFASARQRIENMLADEDRTLAALGAQLKS